MYVFKVVQCLSIVEMVSLSHDKVSITGVWSLVMNCKNHLSRGNKLMGIMCFYLKMSLAQYMLVSGMSRRCLL